MAQARYVHCQVSLHWLLLLAIYQKPRTLIQLFLVLVEKSLVYDCHLVVVYSPSE